MCGIVGIISSVRNVAPDLVSGLTRLAYRGYDSAGVAVIFRGAIDRRRATGKVENLAALLQGSPLSGMTGIGHTRWATHGAPTESNAHPHATAEVAVVHNGIIENYAALRMELESSHVRFESETDTEVIVHLVSHYLRQGLSPQCAAFAAFDRLTGAYAIALIFAQAPDVMIGVRQGTPLAVGYGEGEMFLASDSYALAPLTQSVTFLEDGDRVILGAGSVAITDRSGDPVVRAKRMTAQSGLTTDKGAYRHFMEKEIFEQPAVIAETLSSFLNPTTGALSFPQGLVDRLAAAPRLTLTACGTAFYACAVAKSWFEQLARIPCEIDVASEFRYREAPLPAGGLALVVSQSGETLDTLEALRYCRQQGQEVVAIVNTIESTIEREASCVLHTLAGPEIGVASTKAFTTQLATLLALAIAAGQVRGTLDPERAANLTEALRALPSQIAALLGQLSGPVSEAAQTVAQARDVLYLGRGLMVPLAYEGALKLKEISYIHAEAHAAGEMKHGPIALIDETVPVVALAPSDPLLEKTLSNVREAMARGARVTLITDGAGARQAGAGFERVIVLPDIDPVLSPIFYAVPVQLLAYYAALARGADVDQPRNLAKSVTVE